MTLSRRDRAAMTLALECLRADEMDACDVLLYGGERCAQIMRAADLARPIPLRHAAERMVAARLALALRALLRADDLGRVSESSVDRALREAARPRFEVTCVTMVEWERNAPPPHGPGWRLVKRHQSNMCHEESTWVRQRVPLWQTAPTTNTAPRPAGLRRRTQEETR